MFNVTKKTRKGLSVAATASLAAGLLVGTVAPANAAVDNLRVVKGLTQNVWGYALDSEGPSFIEWEYDNNWDWELVSVPVGSEMDEEDFTASDWSDSGNATIFFDTDSEYSTGWVPEDRTINTYVCDGPDTDTDSDTDGPGPDTDTDNDEDTESGQCYTSRGDMEQFDRAGEYKFEVRADNKVSIVTLVVAEDDVDRVELAVDRTQVAENGDVTFTIKAFDGAGRPTYGWSYEGEETYDGSDTLYEFVTDTDWELDVDGGDWDEFQESDVHFDWSTGAQTIVFDINDEAWDYRLNTNHTFEAEVAGVQSNVVTIRIGENANISGSEKLTVTEVDGKVVQVSDPSTFGSSYAAILKGHRTVSYVFDSGSADNAGKYVYVEIDNVPYWGSEAEGVTSVPASGTWNKLDASGKLTITVTVAENIIDSQDGYQVGVFEYDFTNDQTDVNSDAFESGDNVDIAAQYWGAGETTSVSLVNNAEYVDYTQSDYQWMVPCSPFNDGCVGGAFDEYYKSVLPGQSVDIKVKVTDVFGNVMDNHPVYLDDTDTNYAQAEIWDIESADMAEWADEVETDANGIATFTVKNTESASMTQIELWNGFDVVSYGNDLFNGPGTWVDGFEVYFQTVRSMTVDDLNAAVEGNSDFATWNKTGARTIDDLDGATGAVATDNVAISYNIVNDDEVALWGVPVTFTAVNGFVSADADPVHTGDMTANTVTVASVGDYLGGYAQFTTQKAGVASFTISAAGKTATATPTYSVVGVSAARYITAVESAVNVSAGDITTLSYKVTDRFGNVVPSVAVSFVYGAASNPVLGSPASSLTATDTTDASGITSVDVWTASTVLDQRVSAVTATVTSASAAASACEANKVGAACVALADGYSATAAVKSAVAAINYTVAPVASDVKALKKAFSVTVDNAKGKVVRVYVGSVLKGMFVAKTDSAIRRYKATAGSKVVTVKVETYSRAETVKVRK